MTQHFPTRQLRFYLTAPAPCPYLPQRLERKIFAHLPMTDGATVNDSLTEGGFRRSQNIAYRPACETCSACVSVRIPVADHVAGRSDRKTLNRNADLERRLVEAEATIEDTPVRSHLIEYRRRSEDGGPGELVACTLVDLLADGLSMVYSFYDPEQPRRSLGRFMILDHLAQARLTGMAYVYLGYWVRGSAKMDYKVNFQPIEALGPAGWRLLSARDREG